MALVHNYIYLLMFLLYMNQVPHAMDLLLAEFHRACIYTVPKHITYSEVMFINSEKPFIDVL